MRSLALSVVLATTAAILFSADGHAQEWPSGHLRIFVGSAAGGGADTMARIVSVSLSPALKVPVIVENRTGATGTLAADAVAKAADGHTLLLGTVGTNAIVPHLRKLPYDHTTDLVPIAMLASMPHVLVVNNSLPARSVAELVALAKGKPGSLNYASSGHGSAQQVAAELFQDATGTSLTHVPYKGSSQAMVDLIAGHVQMNFDTLTSALQFIKNGRVRALAVMAPKRSSRVPEVPTMSEAGVKGAEMSAWYGMLAATSVTKAAQARLHSELSKAMLLPDVRTQMDAIGVEPMPMTQAQFAAFLAAENNRFAALIKQRDIKID